MDTSSYPTLDPELRPVVELMPDLTDSLTDLAGARAMLASFVPDGPVPGEELVETAEEQIGADARVRFYRPVGATGRLPGLLYIHGAGFCLGGFTEFRPP